MTSSAISAVEAMEPAWDYDSASRPPAWLEELRHLARNRSIVRELVSRDLKVRYKRSLFGALWSMVAPVAMLTVLTFVFSGLLGARTRSYPLYVFPALMLWNFFAQTASTNVQSVAAGVDLWRGMRIPKTALAIATTIGGVVHLLIATIVLLVIVLLFRQPLGAALLTIPFAIVATALFTLGLALLISTAALYFPDVAHLFQSVLPIWMFATPIVYPASILPPWLQRLVVWNPMTLYADLFRLPIYENRSGSLRSYIFAFAIAAALCALGWFTFTRSADDIHYRG